MHKLLCLVYFCRGNPLRHSERYLPRCIFPSKLNLTLLCHKVSPPSPQNVNQVSFQASSLILLRKCALLAPLHHASFEGFGQAYKSWTRNYRHHNSIHAKWTSSHAAVIPSNKLVSETGVRYLTFWVCENHGIKCSGWNIYLCNGIMQPKKVPLLINMSAFPWKHRTIRQQCDFIISWFNSGFSLLHSLTCAQNEMAGRSQCQWV